MAKKTRKKVKLPVPRSISRLYPNVKFCEEATKAINVDVSRNDCKVGRKSDPTECALAKAVKREFHADAAIIGMTTSYIIKDNKAIRYSTPDSVKREIISFDRHQDFEPGSYYLIPSSPANRLGSHRSSGKSGNHKTRRVYHKTARVRILPSGVDSEA